MAAIYGDPDHPIAIRMFGPGPVITLETKPVGEAWPQITEAQANGYQVYFRPNGGGWRNHETTTTHAAFIDGDDVLLPDALGWHLPPAIVVQRSPTRFQAWWALEPGVSPAQWRDLQLRLCAHYEASCAKARETGSVDPNVATESTLARVAGTWNLKDPGKPVIYRITAADNPGRYSLNAVSAGLPPAGASARRTRLETPPDAAIDTQFKVNRAVGWLEARKQDGQWPAPTGGKPNAPGRTFRTACHIKTKVGLTEAACLAAMRDHYPWSDQTHLRAKVANAYTYSQDGIAANLGLAEHVETYLTGAASGVDPANSDAAPGAWPYLTEAAQDALAERAHLFDGFLEDAINAVLRGYVGRFKSFVAIDIGLSIATGRLCLGKFKPNRTGGVIYLAGEGQTSIGKQRRVAWRKHHGITAEVPFVLVPRVPQVASRHDVDACMATIRRIVAHEFEPKGIPLVALVFDTLLRTMGGLDTNKAGDAQLYFDLLDRVRREFPGVLIVTVAHEGKDRTRGILGSVHFAGAFDNDLQLYNDDDADLKTTRRVTVSCAKLKDAEPFGDFIIQGDQVSFGDRPRQNSLVFSWQGDGAVKGRSRDGEWKPGVADLRTACDLALKSLNVKPTDRGVTADTLATQMILECQRASLLTEAEQPFNVKLALGGDVPTEHDQEQWNDKQEGLRKNFLSKRWAQQTTELKNSVPAPLAGYVVRGPGLEPVRPLRFRPPDLGNIVKGEA